MSVETLEPPVAQATAKPKTIKVLVWDLDNTLWNGTLLEGDDVQPREGVVEVLETLDSRGILMSVASKNSHEDAMAKLQELGLDHFFLYPQIHWSAKSSSLRKIAESINVGIDALAFIDDQPFERDEVQSELSEVTVFDHTQIAELLTRPELMPRFITDESSIRRAMYQADIERQRAEDDFEGPTEEFLASLGMEFTISNATEDDLKRAEELTVRTNQLNSTGVTYSYEELDAFRKSPDHALLVASLDDRYATYGKIGLALVEKGEQVWTLRLLLMSCRVMSRGVGSVMMAFIMEQAKAAGVPLRAMFRETGRNRLMKVSYRFAGFKEVDRQDDVAVLENDLSNIQAAPDYVVLNTPETI